MRKKKNAQYYKSKKRVLKYRKAYTEKVISAIRIATELMMASIQIQIALMQPRRKFENGGENGIVYECGKEPILKAL